MKNTLKTLEQFGLKWVPLYQGTTIETALEGLFGILQVQNQKECEQEIISSLLFQKGEVHIDDWGRFGEMLEIHNQEDLPESAAKECRFSYYGGEGVDILYLKESRRIAADFVEKQNTLDELKQCFPEQAVMMIFDAESAKKIIKEKILDVSIEIEEKLHNTNFLKKITQELISSVEQDRQMYD